MFLVTVTTFYKEGVKGEEGRGKFYKYLTQLLTLIVVQSFEKLSSLSLLA
jgi:hypothetical protein